MSDDVDYTAVAEAAHREWVRGEEREKFPARLKEALRKTDFDLAEWPDDALDDLVKQVVRHLET
jgi:hypothetical protein